MKKLIIGICLVLFLTACTNQRQEYYSNCNTCTKSYTVRKPVEIVYEDVTYTTVYEPKTYVERKRIKQPYNNCNKKLSCY